MRFAKHENTQLIPVFNLIIRDCQNKLILQSVTHKNEVARKALNNDYDYESELSANRTSVFYLLDTLHTQGAERPSSNSRLPSYISRSLYITGDLPHTPLYPLKPPSGQTLTITYVAVYLILIDLSTPQFPLDHIKGSYHTLYPTYI